MSAFGLDLDSIRFGRQARPGEHGDLRPGGLSPLRIRDTGQNMSQVQGAFRSLHYVAVATYRPPLIPAVTTISTPHFGDRPHAAWGQAPKSILEKHRYSDIFCDYRLDGRKVRIQCGTFLGLSCFA